MPELPEVETMRRGLQPIVGLTIRDARCLPCSRKPLTITPGWNAFQKRLSGRKIAGLGRVGKRVVIELDNDDRLIFEPRMTGLVLLADPPTIEHLRLAIDFTRSTAPSLQYWDRRGLGIVRLVTADEFTQRYLQGDIGPDALTISAEEFRERLKPSRRAIKVALLDQKQVAGVGNLYASEML